MKQNPPLNHRTNLSRDLPCRFIQSWILPRSRGMKPRYGSMVGGPDAEKLRMESWAHLVSDDNSSARTPVKIAQDANLFVVEFPASSTKALPVPIKKGRQGYMLCTEGSCILEGPGKNPMLLERHDAAEFIGGSDQAMIKSGPIGALVLFFEMAHEPGNDGRQDM
eukprot:TRINITY_DN8120_c0_g1_i1.p1 TRINITY_DN8120_c0_g1~~TRINITY_DN8120_c0_g1_i1.p1  ORF type:complete len:165 (-),score=24.83 TRINITY_DN8120_c0_g1_i1:312-806(-)